MNQKAHRRAFLATLGVVLALGGAAASGDSLPTPQGTILLTVTGDIAATNNGDSAQFDLEMLNALGTIEYQTETLWTTGTVTFKGPTLSALLDRLGVSSGTIRAHAINDYVIEIPVADVEPEAPMIAYAMNGKNMSRRDKGPLWVVYPYDSEAKYRSEVVYTRSIWQLDRINIVK